MVAQRTEVVNSRDRDLLEALARELPADALVTSPASLEAYRSDMAEAVAAGSPAAAVLPTSIEQIAVILHLADEYRVPVVPRGAGTGLSGGASATDGCIVVSLLRMNRIIEVDAANGVAVVQPGVINADISRAAEQHGLMYAPDPASFEISSVGGNLATNAGGLRCVRYGVTRESVTGLRVVLPGGDIVRTGGRALKDVAGYDLTSLFVGSEGTLGIIAEATLRLRPLAPRQATALATFSSVEAAGRAVNAVLSSATPTMLELLDNTTVRAIEAWRPAGLDIEAAATVIAQCDADPRAGSQAIAARLEDAGASNVVWSSDPAESQLLVGIRRLAYPALERLGAIVLDDVSVPVGEAARLLNGIHDMPPAEGVTVATFGHAGDGNYHPTFVYQRGDTSARARAVDQAAAISALAVDLGGSVTGEHGLGLLKREWYRDRADVMALEVMRRIKDAIDPNGIMNPGKG